MGELTELTLRQRHILEAFEGMSNGALADIYSEATCNCQYCVAFKLCYTEKMKLDCLTALEKYFAGEDEV